MKLGNDNNVRYYLAKIEGIYTLHSLNISTSDAIIIYMASVWKSVLFGVSLHELPGGRLPIFVS